MLGAIAHALRPLRHRMRQAATAIDRGRQGSQRDTARELVQVIDGGHIPTSGTDLVFLCHPASIDADDREGAIPTVTPDAGQTIPVVVLGDPAKAGDLLVAHAIAGRWVAGHGAAKTCGCRWACGPYVQFDCPGEFIRTCATATISVGEGGAISAVDLCQGGADYTVAHPGARVLDGPVSPGGGAVLLATVGEIISLSVTDGGSGYDPAHPPAVTISAPGGGGATATARAVVDPETHGISGLTITNPGSLYPVANPTVTIGAPGAGGRRATAVAAAKPGVVTSLKLVAPGSGYIDNTPPPYLNFTISFPGWIRSLQLLPGLRPDVAAGYVLNSADGTPSMCTYSGTKVVDIPASGACPAIEGATLSAIVANTVGNGWCLMVDFTVTPSDHSDTCSCLTLAAGFPGTAANAFHVPLEHGPFGPASISCPSRPFAWTQDFSLGINDRAYPQGEEGWYVLAGGHCTGIPGDIRPNLSLAMSLSEP